MFTQDRPMTRDEMNERIQRMTEERQRQVLEARALYSQSSTGNALRFQTIADKPMTRDEMNERIQRMAEERQRQQLSFRSSAKT